MTEQCASPGGRFGAAAQNMGIGTNNLRGLNIRSSQKSNNGINGR